MSSDDPREQAHRAARSAERWSTASMWLSGCSLVLLVGGLVGAVAVGVAVWMALR